ncbi:hypothetical protein EIP86_002808 [Pleurotus ostreatoroseus]|nr:hypothetical protein EIP86_002808 [Pleurotus ostreatoroseus]
MGKDTAMIMASPIGQPMATLRDERDANHLVLHRSRSVRSYAHLTPERRLPHLCRWIVGVNTLVAASRQTFAFARDGALPLSRYLYRMNRYTQTPVNCVWAVSFVGLLLGLLAFAGQSATSAIFSLTVVGLYIAYTIPIASRLLSKTPWRPGPFSLGIFSIPVATTAVIWNTLAIVIVMFPTNPGPTGSTMNYTVVVSGGWISLCIAYYFFPKYGGMYWFKGPMANIELEQSGEVSGSVEEVVESISETKDEKYLGK